jgi:hypothetical protein
VGEGAGSLPTIRTGRVAADEVANNEPRVLLEYHDEGVIELTADERERLERICVAPNDDDNEWLAQFDERLGRLDDEA